MKKLLTVLICLSLLLSLTSCGELPEWEKKPRYYGFNGAITSPDGENYECFTSLDVFDGIRVTRGKALGTCHPIYYGDSAGTIYEFDKNSGAILIDWGPEPDYDRHNLSIMIPEGGDFYNYRDSNIGGIAFIPWIEEIKTDEFHDFSKYIRKHGFTGENAKAIHEAIYSTDIIDYDDYRETDFAGYLIFYPEDTDSFCFLAEVIETYEHGFVVRSIEISYITGYLANSRDKYWRCANSIPEELVEKLGITTDIWG